MKIEKVYNNNVVQSKNLSGDEIILMGTGLGFQKRAGDVLDESKVEKTFVLYDSDKLEDFSQFYRTLPEVEVELVLELIAYAKEKLDVTFETGFYIGLADHIHYAIERHRQNLPIQNPLSWEIKKFYPKEYQLGRKAVQMILERMQLLLPEDEISSIALHFINVQKDKIANEESYHITKMVHDILGIVRLYYGKIADEDSISYNRFVTHVQYFAQRVSSGLIQGKNDSFLYEQVKLNYPAAFACTQRIKAYVRSSYDFDMSYDEQVYLTIHISRLETS
ncbi:BglG family transcription antiterminator LicT [Streptococcus sciuri]|uniref:PRD domain-containing protein n=1 Tax=Streptococcus sciuri TaxID=2973939 RepID=A0ABT2F4Q2_9STRE|nr:PRD domain-containing protein [Streptococcus sciuri]MCS4487449.1 PRD domain-containing protein [Streptococcus sciuri]